MANRELYSSPLPVSLGAGEEDEMHYLSGQGEWGESGSLKFMEIYVSPPDLNCLLLGGQSCEARGESRHQHRGP